MIVFVFVVRLFSKIFAASVPQRLSPPSFASEILSNYSCVSVYRTRAHLFCAWCGILSSGYRTRWQWWKGGRGGRGVEKSNLFRRRHFHFQRLSRLHIPQQSAADCPADPRAGRKSRGPTPCRSKFFRDWEFPYGLRVLNSSFIW